MTKKPSHRTPKKPAPSAKPSGGFRPGAGRKPGAPNKSTADIQKLVRDNVDFEKLTQSLARRAMKGNLKAAKLLYAYGWGRPPQQLNITGDLSLEYFDTLRKIADKVMGEMI